ncbi:General transcription factor IIIC, polypeptide 3 [Boothiomyces macroporosus]|uniref:General transcription factor IIIC, polypeptide 3 n=1 Tax=Boothiomyces macroporosus TaxID=261099 RepID=A0AAD5UPY7_9FUNG|nr:General transcription factor IIIC, polypeptide 3 [Boothiomyces macroporosus]
MDDRFVTNSSQWQVDTDINYHMDDMTHELSGFTDLNDQEEDDMPLGIQHIMQDAMLQAGHIENYNQLLYEDDEDDAMMEIDEHFGPENERLLMQNVANYKPVKRKRKGKRKVPKSYASLSDELNEMMQSANLRYIMGDEDQALEILRKVIHERPDAHEAWLSLGMIYNRRQDLKKMVECNMLAAHLSPKNGHLWKTLGFTSKEMNNIELAIYCFKKAVKFDSSDIESLWELSTIYIDQKQNNLALEGLNKILLIDNANPFVIKEIAKLYRENGEQEKALQLFENLEFLDQNVPLSTANKLDDELDMDDEEEAEVMGSLVKVKQRFGFEEISITMDLYIDLQEYEKALQCMKRGVARLHGYNVFDIDYNSDEEYEEGGYDVPLEILIKLGICRYLLGDIRAAKVQFDKLFHAEVDQYALLSFHVAELYMNGGQHEEALKYLKHICTGIDSESPVVWAKMAECYVELEEHNLAIEMYEQVLAFNPDNVEIQHAIIRIYEDIGEIDTAEKMQKRFANELEKRRSLLNNYVAPVYQSRIDYQPLFKYQSSVKRNEPKKPELENTNREEENSFLIMKLKQLGVNLDTSSKRQEYLRASRKLVDRFQNNPKHYLRKNSRDTNILRDYKARFLTFDEQADPEQELKMDKTFEGIRYCDWYNLLVEHVRLLAIEGRDEEAFQALKNTHNSDVYFPDFRKRYQLKLLCIEQVSMPDGFAMKDPTWLMEYGYIVQSPLFAISPTQKSLHRQLLKMANTDEDAHAHFFTLMGHIHLLGKNYQVAIHYYLKAKSILPDEPVINLCLAVSFLHRAFHKAERRSDNLIKGFTFVTQYRRLMNNSSESDYNVARAFHHVGLIHVAIPIYERCLDTEYGTDAAYNLHLIYIESGSYLLAKQVLKQCCTF